MSRPMVDAVLSISLKPLTVTFSLSPYISGDKGSLDKKVARLTLFYELDMNCSQLFGKGPSLFSIRRHIDLRSN